MNDQCCFRWLPILAWLLCTLTGMDVRAAARDPFNPKPTAGDLELPMPDGAKMVFRKVLVPGRNFWGDPRRIVQLGDGEGGIFEGLQRVQVSGSFPETGDQSGGASAGTAGLAQDQDSELWSYYLGKYEVTKGQYIAVMGMQHFLQQSGDSALKAKLSTLQGGALEKELAKPLVFVSRYAIGEFIHRYNLWLFDEQHPLRLESIPSVDGAPGFVRLPTELEWEYATRGGLPALEEGRFKTSLPFARSKLKQHAWYLKNAKHKLRPIGLRKASSLGFHDLLGNAQELCAGLFYPELWQGKPGGLVARGGSVATRERKLRSAHREEVEIYKWVAEANAVREWRSYNTGIRLALGSNVVLSPKNRQRLEQDYQQYTQGIRARMPVGKTLDNFVAQASGQLSDATQRLNEVLGRNEDLKGELARVQKDIDKAQERLDFAMRASAESSARDLLREASDIGRDVFKIASFRQQQQRLEQLSATSTRYQDLIHTMEKEIAKREDYMEETFSRYLEDIHRLGEFGPDYIREALNKLAASSLTTRAREALGLIERHLQEYRKLRRPQAGQWRKEFQQTFAVAAD